MNDEYDELSSIRIHTTREGVKVTTRKSRYENPELMAGAQASLIRISEQPDFRGFSMGDLRKVARMFERTPPEFEYEH